MREREIAGLLRDKHPDGMQQLLLHYGPLIRYIIAPIVPDAHDLGGLLLRGDATHLGKGRPVRPPARQLESMAHRRHAEHGL